MSAGSTKRILQRKRKCWAIFLANKYKIIFASARVKNYFMIVADFFLGVCVFFSWFIFFIDFLG